MAVIIVKQNVDMGNEEITSLKKVELVAKHYYQGFDKIKNLDKI